MTRLSLALLLVALTSCTSTQTLSPESGSGARANSAFAGKTVQLTRTDGTTVDAQSVVIYGDSTSWVDPETQALVQVPTAEVASVSQRSRGRGLLQGALLSGLITSVTVGTLALADSGDWGGFEGAKPAFVLAIGTVVFLPGTVPGAVIGYARGSERRYEVLPTEQAIRRNARGQYSPTGSTSRLMR